MGADACDLKGEQPDLQNQKQETSEHDDLQKSRERKNWEPMRLTFTGDAKDIVQVGPGKLSTPGGDPGEARKQGPAG